MPSCPARIAAEVPRLTGRLYVSTPEGVSAPKAYPVVSPDRTLPSVVGTVSAGASKANPGDEAGKTLCDIQACRDLPNR